MFHPMLQAHSAGRAGKGPPKRKIGNLRSIRAPEGLRVNLRSRSGLKAQQAHSPGQRPGWNEAMKCALKGQKRK